MSFLQTAHQSSRLPRRPTAFSWAIPPTTSAREKPLKFAPSPRDGIFINYRREDSAGFAGRLADSLGAWFGPERVFRDVGGIDYGEDFEAKIDSKPLFDRKLLAYTRSATTVGTSCALTRRTKSSSASGGLRRSRNSSTDASAPA